MKKKTGKDNLGHRGVSVHEIIHSVPEHGSFIACEVSIH